MHTQADDVPQSNTISAIEKEKKNSTRNNNNDSERDRMINDCRILNNPSN